MPILNKENCLIIKIWLEIPGIKRDLRKALEELTNCANDYADTDPVSETLDKQINNTFITDLSKNNWKNTLRNPCDCYSLQMLTTSIIGYDIKGKYIFIQIDTSKDHLNDIECYISILQTFWGWFGEYIEMKLYKDGLPPQVMFNVEDQVIFGALENHVSLEEWNCKKLKLINVEYGDVTALTQQEIEAISSSPSTASFIEDDEFNYLVLEKAKEVKEESGHILYGKVFKTNRTESGSIIKQSEYDWPENHEYFDAILEDMSQVQRGDIVKIKTVGVDQDNELLICHLIERTPKT